MLFLVSVVVVCCGQLKAERTITADEVRDKVRGMWVGQLIGNSAGRETEGHYQATANPASSVPWVIKQVWDADDDTDIEYIALHILETDGFDCNSAEMAGQWREHITIQGIYIANRQAWYMMGGGYLPPETGGRGYNEHWYSIDSQITTEVLGALCPGMAQEAINLTGKFARISNDGFPVHAAQLYAGMYAEAFFEPNVVTLLRQGLDTIPVSSRTYRVADDVLGWYIEDAEDGELDWRAARQKLYNHYQGAESFGRYYYWIESTVNTGATILALLYGQGDFKETVQIGVLAGWDCDCNPATVGGLIGIINGYSGLPADLTDPCLCGDVYKNVFRPYLPDPCEYLPQYETISHIAERITQLAEQNILAHGGYITCEPDKIYHIPEFADVVPEEEKPDPAGPVGLVAQAAAVGITVTPTAAVQRYNDSLDRENLNAVIDGITDNSYNGHKAYYSFQSDPSQRPAQDWYQLNFSQPVKFESLTFYEGDVVWDNINRYYINDNVRGGFFSDLTVEVFRDGRYFEPGGLAMAPEPDRFRMYQVITFTFSPTVGDAVRIIGDAGGTEEFTTILELEAQGDVEPGLYVASVRIAEGQSQRSEVSLVEVEFSRDVTIAAGDVELAGIVNGTVLEADEIYFTYDSPTRTLTLKFDIDGDDVFDDSLPDDFYNLRLECDGIRDGGGQALLDDDTNPGDGCYTIEFHRLFGDSDGSGAVDKKDFAVLCGVWLGEPCETGLDGDGDGVVAMPDFAGITGNWLVKYRF